MQPHQRRREALVIAGKTAGAEAKAKSRSTTYLRGSSTKPPLASGNLTTACWSP
jgi:hypothetical protein